MKPLLLLSRGDDDAEFIYACRLAIEQALYVRFSEADDLLIVSTMELERARREGRAARVVDRADVGWSNDADTLAAWIGVARNVLGDRARSGVRVSPNLPAAAYEALREAGIEREIDHGLFLDERRRKSPEEADFIHAAQEAAEAACLEVIGMLAAGRPESDGALWLDGSPLTSERLMARAHMTLGEIGYGATDMIVAGSPECAIPHFSGAGPVRAGAPVIIDIFPRGRTSHYHGDLTRTVVVGDVPATFQRMHQACVDALDRAIGRMAAGVNAREVHHAVCQALVEHGFGTSTEGYAGVGKGPRMIHSTGHGVGLEVHELPHLRDADMALQAGDVVTIEPGLYEVGLGGVRVEDTGLVTANGFRNFTSLPRSLDPRDYV